MKNLKTMNLKSLTSSELKELRMTTVQFSMTAATRHPHEVTIEGPTYVLEQLSSLGVTDTLTTMIAPFSAGRHFLHAK